MKFIVKKNVLLELFLIFNLFFLTFDILIAHATNGFKHWAEYIPLFFSFVSSMVLIFFFFYKNKFPVLSKRVNIGIGACSFFTGVVGLYFHLHSNFLFDPTLKNLVYTAPLVAPLAYSGIGLLLIFNAIYKSKDSIWIYMTLICGWIGFFGNFILSLCDHAQNGFFYVTEWIPIVSSAVLIGVFAPLLISRPTRELVKLCEFVLFVQILVGSLGFILHFIANFPEAGSNPIESFIFGAPIFAPLLFVNLAILLIFPISSLAKRIENQKWQT